MVLQLFEKRYNYPLLIVNCQLSIINYLARLQRPEVQKHDHLWAIAHRIKNLQIFNKDAFEIIKEFDSPDTLFYCDPCYLPKTRTSPQRYVHDLTTEQHIALAELLEVLFWEPINARGTK